MMATKSTLMMRSMVNPRVFSKATTRFTQARRSPMIPSSSSSRATTATTTTRTSIRTSATTTAGGSSSGSGRNFSFAQGLLGGVALAGLHSATGSQNEFYDYRYKSQKEADDLATFFGSEDFMELFCIFPFVGHIMMRMGEFDEKGDVITMGVPGTMKVSMVFSDEANGDTIEWFNKRERFHNTLFGYTMWDMVSNFGFRTLEDGTLECYHYGEYFHGNLPIVSQIVLLVFKIHARWVAWSAEHHINHYAFTADTEEEEEWEEESRKNMPIFLLKHFFLVDLKAMVFGLKKEDENEEEHHEKSPSFLVRRGSSTDTADDKLPIQNRGTLIQIHQDIAYDRAAVKDTLAKAATRTKEEAKIVLARKFTTVATSGDNNSKSTSAYGAAMEAAKSHHMARRGSLRDLSDLKLDTKKKATTKAAAPASSSKGGDQE